MRICFIGDSFVNGAGDPECLGWVGRICAAARRAGHDLTCYNLGIRRDTSADIRARWRREAALRLPPSEPAGLVFSFAANDTTIEPGEAGRRRVAPEQSLANAAAILRAACRRCPTLMVGPPPLADDEQNHRIVALSRALGDVCLRAEVPYLPVAAALLGATHWLREVTAGNGAHPGANGYAELAGLVQRWPAWQAWLAPSHAGSATA